MHYAGHLGAQLALQADAKDRIDDDVRLTESLD
jgi:hypothetical protein